MMNESIDRFFSESKIAEKVHLETRIVLQRTKLSPGDLVQISKKKEYGPVPQNERLCELEVGGLVLAKGRIVKKRGEYYFKATEMPEDRHEQMKEENDECAKQSSH